MSAGGPQHGWPCQRGLRPLLRHSGSLHQSASPAPHRGGQPRGRDRCNTRPATSSPMISRIKAIRMIRERSASRPGQPFFLYMAHPAAHAPLSGQARQTCSLSRRLQRRVGTCIRQQRHANQLEFGIHPGGHRATAAQRRTRRRCAAVERPERRRADPVCALHGRVRGDGRRDRSKRRPAAGERWKSAASGTTRSWCSSPTTAPAARARPMAPRTTFAHLGVGRQQPRRPWPRICLRLDDVGGPQVMTHYPRGWAMASNTPFRLYKRNTHAGGHQVPCIWSWPQGLRRHGGAIRTQYGHCIDVLANCLGLGWRRRAAAAPRTASEADERSQSRARMC